MSTAEGFEQPPKHKRAGKDKEPTTEASVMPPSRLTPSERFDAMHRTMMRGFFGLGGITVTLFVALAGLQGF